MLISIKQVGEAAAALTLQWVLPVGSLGLEAGVDIGSLVVHDGEQEVGRDLPNLLVIGGGAFKDAQDLWEKVIVELGKRVLLEELTEYLLGGVCLVLGVACNIASHVKVATKSTCLSGQVGNSA